jgi:hypothetical protein
VFFFSKQTPSYSTVSADCRCSRHFRTKCGNSFAEQAKKNLSTAEFQTLLQFLTRSPPTHDVDYLQGQMAARLEAFYTAEQELTAESPNTLAGPSGPKNAELGLIMHCQSKKEILESYEIWKAEAFSPWPRKG